MSREQKFRAWNGDRYIELNNLRREKTVYFSPYDLGVIPPEIRNKVVLEQCTGLKDKDGKEICGGDIVLDYYDGDDAFIVEWDKDTASFRLTDTDNITSVSFDNFYPEKDLEVIGNIHENPVLLEKK